MKNKCKIFETRYLYNIFGFENAVRLSKLLKPTDKLFPLENQEHIGINENEQFLKELKEILK